MIPPHFQMSSNHFNIVITVRMVNNGFVGATHMHQSLRFLQQHREGERGTHAAAASPFPATACSKVIQPTPPTGHGIGAQQVSPASQSQNRLSRV
jgi:hypothetical protein